MADNFLEKRMEQHRAQAASSVAQRSRATLAALIDRCAAAPSVEGYAVRADQLKRIVSAAVKLPACSALRYKLLLSSSEPLFEAVSLSPAMAYIVICSSCEPDAFVLGRAVQVMQLQAAEIGLSAMLVEGVDVSELLSTSLLPFVPCALLSVGRAALSLSCDSLSVDDFLI